MAYLGEQDLFLFNEGTHIRLYEKLGAHAGEVNGKKGTHFAVWAPNAGAVSVIGNFNGWEKGRTKMEPIAHSGIWHAFVPGVGNGEVYKYHIQSRERGYEVDKADPFGFKTELPPKTASVTWDLSYEWSDDEWMKTRGTRQHREAPISIYELHVGSWFHLFEESGHRSYSYRELAEPLARYVSENGFTHVELMPISEHPFYGSWGYQVTGYFAPTARFGDPQDLMYLVDYLHQRGIGVILDWVPAHFPSDEHGLAYFDGTHLFEHADPRRGYHPDWNSLIFNYGRHEVKAFLLSSAVFWLERYHIDGLRVDGVASMLYLDYSREGDEWIPNEYGGNENLEAIDFLRRFNEVVYEQFPSATTIAEESTAWPMVSKPTYLGGLGFGFKWDMGWMHDTLTYFQREPVYRKYHQNDLTFRGVYAFHENFVLPLSHDEVVHGKGSLIGKMPGDDWQKFANLRLLYAFMFATPAKKLLFMGGEFGQWNEWSHDRSLDWSLLEQPSHRGMLSLVAELNRLYREMPALHELDYTHEGFEWIDASDTENSVIVLARKGKSPRDYVICAFNFTPVPRENYRVGVDLEGHWRELLNSDANDYGGSGVGNLGRVEASPVAWHGRRFSLNLVLPPLGAVWFVHEG